MGIFLPRQSILAPVGLVSQPNQYGQYPAGALKVARNMLMRNPGELIQAPDVQAVQSVGIGGNIVLKLMPLDDGHVYSVHLNGSTWTMFENANAVTVPFTPNVFSSTGRISPTRVAGRVLFNTLRGHIVGDFMAPTSAGERELRLAGFPQPRITLFSNVEAPDGWQAVDTAVGYQVCFFREFSDGYRLRSAPSPLFKVWQSTSGPHNVQLTVNWSDSLKVGDKIEVYRTDILASTTAYADPGTTCKRVLSYNVTSTDVANRFAVIVDRQRPIPTTSVSPGEELYSNPGQEGETFANRQPPIAACTESFKGFAFFGNTVDRALWVFSIPGGIGVQAIAETAGATAAYFKSFGIGARTGAGTITSGSPTITAVSAADIVGIRVGQRWDGNGGAQFPIGTAVTAVGATTITMAVAAGSSGTTFMLDDVLELNGFAVQIRDLTALVYRAGAQSIEINVDTALSTGNVYNTGLTFSIEPGRYYSSDNTVTVRGTNGQNYSPPIPEITASVQTFTGRVLKNRLQWSKEQQPEHCPSVNEAFVGFGEIYAMNGTRDAFWIWCSDGLFRLSGHAGALGLGAWQIDPAQPTLILAGPQASCSLNEFVYGYTNIGFVEVDSAGSFVNLTDKILGDLLPGQKYTESRNIVVVANETDEEVLLILGDNGSNASNVVYVFNTKTRAWTTLGDNGASLSNITAMAMQRSPVSGEPRVLFGVSPVAAPPSYSGWNSASAFLTGAVQYQPIYADDPLSLKQWIWGDYLFGPESNGKTIAPTWNGTQYGGNVATQTLDTNGAFARAGVPQQVALSHSISPGFMTLAGAPQSRFQGMSIAFKSRTNQSKKR